MTRPQQYRPCLVMVSREDSLRLDAFVQRVGKLAALRRLGCGLMTLDAAIDEGRMQRSTRDRLFAALDRESVAA